MADKIAFNTANLVARETGWRFKLADWGKQDALTRERTDEAAWEAICREIADAGYRAVEIWAAHVDPAKMTDARAQVFRRILDDHALEPIGLAGPLTADTARVCRLLGIPVCNGGLGGAGIDEVREVARQTGVGFNYENHPEKSVGEIRTRIDGGAPGAPGVSGAPGIDDIGVAVDTGWLGTQGLHAPTAVRALGPLVRHVHLKDVRHAGGHETCPLGEGVVDVRGVMKVLADIGYDGWYSWEDEPEDRNPFDIAGPMREWIQKHIGGGAR